MYQRIRVRSEREYDCPFMSKRTLLLLGLLCAPTVAAAQSSTSALSSPYEQRGFVQVGAGAQGGSHLLTSTSTFTIYDEPATIQGSQNYGGGALFTIGGGAKVWRNLVVGLHYTRYSDTLDTVVNARVPHPLFANRLRDASQDIGGLKHSENGYHFTASWMFPPGEDLVLGVGLGPSFVQVAHEFPSAAGVTETGTAPDFATVGLENVSFTRGEKTTGTVNVGADLTYNLPFDLGQAGRLGATLGFRYAGGTVGLQGTTGEVDVKYGGAQFFGGLRVSF